MDTSSFIFWWQIFKWFKVWKGQINCQLSAHYTMFGNHPKKVSFQFYIWTFALKTPKINMCNWQCRIPFNLRIFEIFFVIFIHCKLNKHLQCKVWKIIKTLSRFPPIAMKHYCRNRISKLRRHQEFPGFARLKNCNERRSVGKISKEEKIRKKDAVLFRLDRQILEVKNSKRGVKLASLLRFMSLSTVLYFSYFVPEEPHKGI